MHADLCEFTGICGYNSQLLTNFYLRLTQPGAIGRILSPAMKLKRENTRSRLFLTLGLAVVLPWLGYATWHLYTHVVDRNALELYGD